MSNRLLVLRRNYGPCVDEDSFIRALSTLDIVQKIFVHRQTSAAQMDFARTLGGHCFPPPVGWASTPEGTKRTTCS
jgi:hypothetical protein